MPVQDCTTQMNIRGHTFSLREGFELAIFCVGVVEDRTQLPSYLHN